MDPRLKEINKVFTAFSQGIFTKRLDVPDSNDELSSCMWMFNIVGEELQKIAIHRDFFLEIFNTVDRMIFVVSARGYIEEVNKAATSCLQFEREELLGLPFTKVFKEFKHTRWERFNDALGGISQPCYYFSNARDNQIPVSITIKLLKDPNRGKKMIITAKDLSTEINLERDNIRRQIFGQEQERLKLSRDLHDGVGQRLSAIRFLLLSIAPERSVAGDVDKFHIADTTLLEVIEEIRTLSFSLMPAAIGDHGLYEALRELCDKIWLASQLDIKLEYDIPEPSGDHVNIDLYRIIQEFLSNTLKHGRATKVWIGLKSAGGKIGVTLRDNGIGFELATAKRGMGLDNIESRVKAHEGQMTLVSKVGRGTRIHINIII